MSNSHYKIREKATWHFTFKNCSEISRDLFSLGCSKIFVDEFFDTANNQLLKQDHWLRLRYDADMKFFSASLKIRDHTIKQDVAYKELTSTSEIIFHLQNILSLPVEQLSTNDIKEFIQRNNFKQICNYFFATRILSLEPEIRIERLLYDNSEERLLIKIDTKTEENVLISDVLKKVFNFELIPCTSKVITDICINNIVLLQILQNENTSFKSATLPLELETVFSTEDAIQIEKFNEKQQKFVR